MKKIMMMTMLMTIAITVNAMTYNEAHNEALFLTDKMAYELGLNDAQYEAVYQINLDYLMGLNSRADLYGARWSVRDRCLVRVLTPAQYRLFLNRGYFYRPVSWGRNAWVFNIYSRYHRNHYFHHRPLVAHGRALPPRHGHGTDMAPGRGNHGHHSPGHAGPAPRGGNHHGPHRR